MHLYHQCDMGMSGRIWPDGGALLDQPNKLVAAFSVIGSQLETLRKVKT